MVAIIFVCRRQVPIGQLIRYTAAPRVSSRITIVVVVAIRIPGQTIGDVYQWILLHIDDFSHALLIGHFQLKVTDGMIGGNIAVNGYIARHSTTLGRCIDVYLAILQRHLLVVFIIIICTTWHKLYGYRRRRREVERSFIIADIIHVQLLLVHLQVLHYVLARNIQVHLFPRRREVRDIFNLFGFVEVLSSWRIQVDSQVIVSVALDQVVRLIASALLFAERYLVVIVDIFIALV